MFLNFTGLNFKFFPIGMASKIKKARKILIAAILSGVPYFAGRVSVEGEVEGEIERRGEVGYFQVVLYRPGTLKIYSNGGAFAS